MKLNKATWAKRYGVSRAAVTLAVKSGALVEDNLGYIDDGDKANVAWLARRTKPDPKPKPPREPKPKKPKPAPPLPPPPKIFDDMEPLLLDDSADTDDLGILTVQKMQAEIRYKQEAAEAYRVKRLATLGVLVEKEHVRQVLGKFNAEMRIRLLELPGTIAPRLLALIQAGETEHGIAKILEHEIEAAILAAKAVFTSEGLQ